MAEYSICITQYNSLSTVRRSLDSILEQIDSRYEVVVVDNCSDDGSRQLLEEYSANKRIKLIEAKCSRGKGRQIAFENSSGEYIVSNMDMDDMFAPVLSKAIQLYHQNCEGMMLHVHSTLSDSPGGAVTIAPRALIRELGGWRDLQWFEDRDLWARAVGVGKYRWTYYPLYLALNSHPERRRDLTKLRWSIIRQRDADRIGLQEKKSVPGIPVYLVAWIISRFKPRYNEGKAFLERLKEGSAYLNLIRSL